LPLSYADARVLRARAASRALLAERSEHGLAFGQSRGTRDDVILHYGVT